MFLNRVSKRRNELLPDDHACVPRRCVCDRCLSESTNASRIRLFFFDRVIPLQRRWASVFYSMFRSKRGRSGRFINAFVSLMLFFCISSHISASPLFITNSTLSIDDLNGQVFTPAEIPSSGVKASMKVRFNENVLIFLIGGLAVTIIILVYLAVHLRRQGSVRCASEQRFALAVSGANDAIWDWDIENGDAFFSPRLMEMLDYVGDSEPAKNNVQDWKDRIHPDDRERTLVMLEEYLRGNGDLFASEHRLRTRWGDYIWVLVRGKAMRNAAGKTIRISGSITDITIQKQQEAALQHHTLHDSLTGLPNRTLLKDRLQQAVFFSRRENKPLALLLIDLNRFKEINDTLGHQIGDRLLQHVGTRLLHLLRDTDTVARLGGDEFAVLLPDASRAYARQNAQNILKALEQVFEVDGHELFVDGSVGIALYPQHGDDAQTLMQRADIAMYVAKRFNSGFSVYDIQQDQHSVGRLALISDLHSAINHDALELRYQPIFDLRNGSITGIEALLCWNHPERGFIQPDEIIPVAEHTGLIRPLTLWVFNTALRQCAEWRRRGLDLKVAVNLSTWNLHDYELYQQIKGRLTAWDLPASCLVIEITESAMMADPDRAMEILTHLSAMGVQVSVDDYGTGFSSLAYLKKLPVDELKIAKPFVSGMTEDENDGIIVRSTIDLAHNLGLRVVAEGVENKDTWELLVILGCDAVQGYYMCRPQPADILERMFEESFNSDYGDKGASLPEPAT